MRKATALGNMSAYIFTNNAHFFCFIAIGFIVLIVYCIAGFIGIALCGIGVISTPVTLLSINSIAGMTTDAHRLAELSHLNYRLIMRLYKIAWPSKNYGIHI